VTASNRRLGSHRGQSVTAKRGGTRTDETPELELADNKATVKGGE